MMKTFEQIIKTAQKKYQEAIRGRLYQDELITKTKNTFEIDFLYSRRANFVAEIALLEDVFGTKLLQSEN